MTPQEALALLKLIAQLASVIQNQPPVLIPETNGEVKKVDERVKT